MLSCFHADPRDGNIRLKESKLMMNLSGYLWNDLKMRANIFIIEWNTLILIQNQIAATTQTTISGFCPFQHYSIHLSYPW